MADNLDTTLCLIPVDAGENVVVRETVSFLNLNPFWTPDPNKFVIVLRDEGESTKSNFFPPLYGKSSPHHC